MALVFATPTGTATGFGLANASPAGIITVSSTKSGNSPGDTLSAWATGAGMTPTGAPGSLSDYMGGLGIMTGMSGRFMDKTFSQDGAAVGAAVDAQLNTLNISGVAFHRTVDSSCSPLSGHGIESIIAYFQDNRLVNNHGKYTVVKIGDTTIQCVVVSVSFSMLDMLYNLWKWELGMLVAPDIKAGATTANATGGA